MGQPNVVSDSSRHNGNGHEVPKDSGVLYQAGFEAGFDAGKQEARPPMPGPSPQSRAAQEPAKRVIGLPCPTCGAYFYTDEECPRCKQGAKVR